MLSHIPINLRNQKIGRRRCIELGLGGAMGLSLLDLLSAQSKATSDQQPPSFGQAKSCVLIFLFGGPGQQDLWDMKPDAPAEIRGDFRPISTKVSGVSISEYLPQMSQQADKITIVRSVSHRDFEHGSASYTALTGHPHPKPGTNTPASKNDFPTYGAVISKVKPTPKPIPSAVILGPVMHQGNRPPMAGQNAGFLGNGYDPFRVAANPGETDFQVGGLHVPFEMTTQRQQLRFDLLNTLGNLKGRLNTLEPILEMSQLKRRVHGLLASAHSQHAFTLSDEPQKVRERYGPHRFGQTMLLARRLVEAEVPLVTINWARSNNDQWDTHSKNYAKLREILPPFDQGLASFLADLDQRGLLDTTLVVCLGEFGRTPKINKDAGRDHWPDCYSVLLAGGGIGRGVVYGSSDPHAAYPASDPVAPWDLAATAYHLLGVDPQRHIYDRVRRPFVLAPGNVLTDCLL